MKSLVKTAALFFSIFLCTIILFLVRAVLIFWPLPRSKATGKIVHFFGKVFVKILNIKINISGQKHLLRKKGVLFVCNHLGYIDGIVATALSPLVFIAKSDIRAWPFFGIFALLSDTIFINRANSCAVKREVENVVSFLKKGTNVILFPEGTSTNGEKLLPFKSSFFIAPFQAKAPVIPLVIAYDGLNGKAIDEANRDLLCWYGGMKFFPHLLGVLSLDNIMVSVRVCSPITSFFNYQGDASLHRKKIRDVCWSAINRHLEVRAPKGQVVHG
jgi:1-acyl-sn-glycerol-3-phosphate acyltransferase